MTPEVQAHIDVLKEIAATVVGHPTEAQVDAMMIELSQIPQDIRGDLADAFLEMKALYKEAHHDRPPVHAHCPAIGPLGFDGSSS